MMPAVFGPTTAKAAEEAKLRIDKVMNFQVAHNGLSGKASEIAWALWALIFWSIPLTQQSADAIVTLDEIGLHMAVAKDKAKSIVTPPTLRRDFDCDDYSWRLLGAMNHPNRAYLLFGFIWSNGHAFCFFINEDRVFKIVEPQNDGILMLAKAGSMYNPITLAVG